MYCAQPKSLTELALCDICVTIYTSNWPKYGVITLKQIDSLTTPPKIKEIFKTRVQEMSKWVDKHHTIVPCGPQVLRMIKWNLDGNINAIDTLASLLEGNTLTNEHKFAIASVYCDQEQIERVWELGLDNTKLWSYATVVSYWSWRCSGRRHPFAQSLVHVAFREALDNGWSEAVLFFFSQLESETDRLCTAAETFTRAVNQRQWQLATQIWRLCPDHRCLATAASACKFGRPDVDLCVAVAQAGDEFPCAAEFIAVLLNELPLIDRHRLLWTEDCKVFCESVRLDNHDIVSEYLRVASRTDIIQMLFRAQNYRALRHTAESKCKSMAQLMWSYVPSWIEEEFIEITNQE